MTRLLDSFLNPMQTAPEPDPCQLCGGQHIDRKVYRCSLCAKPLCVTQIHSLGENKPAAHFRPGVQVDLSFCGYAFATKDETV